MLFDLEKINMTYITKSVKFIKICIISLHICNLDFMNWIYIILKYNSGYVKKWFAKLLTSYSTHNSIKNLKNSKKSKEEHR